MVLLRLKNNRDKIYKTENDITIYVEKTRRFYVKIPTAEEGTMTLHRPPPIVVSDSNAQGKGSGQSTAKESSVSITRVSAHKEKKPKKTLKSATLDARLTATKKSPDASMDIHRNSSTSTQDLNRLKSVVTNSQH